MEKSEIVNSIDAIVEQAYQVIKNRKYGNNVLRVHFFGESICIDVFSKDNLVYTVSTGLLSETFYVLNMDDFEDEATFRLLPIKSLKILFEIYSIKNGKNKHYEECYSKSCIRHLF
jgi:hypothetical protein